MTELARPNPPTLPREAWANHPRFPNQTLLLGSHRNFREVSQILIHANRAGEPRETLELLYQRWIGAMRGHEAYEEDKLYPYLSRRWNLSFEAAEAGHEALHAAHDEVLEAFALRDRGGVQTALERHHAVLEAHLELEEDLVIPALLGLSPDEFDTYYHSDLSSLLRALETAPSS